eukprot:XP_011673901.1 PREDICTED: uncharacterized protein LOC105442928 [Strongylocentrotus purpuratus]
MDVFPTETDILNDGLGVSPRFYRKGKAPKEVLRTVLSAARGLQMLVILLHREMFYLHLRTFNRFGENIVIGGSSVFLGEQDMFSFLSHLDVIDEQLHDYDDHVGRNGSTYSIEVDVLSDDRPHRYKNLSNKYENTSLYIETGVLRGKQFMDVRQVLRDQDRNFNTDRCFNTSNGMCMYLDAWTTLLNLRDDIMNRTRAERDVVLGEDEEFHHMDYGLYDLVLLQQGLVEGSNNGGTRYTHPFSRSIFVKKCLREIQAEIDHEKALDDAEAAAKAAYRKAEADKKAAKEMEFADDEEDCDEEDIDDRRHENAEMKYLVGVCLKIQEEEDYEPDHHSDYSVEDNVYGRDDSDEEDIP